MSTTRYSWRDGARIKLDAETAGAELDRIAQERGGLTPATVVEEARPKDAPLHNAFEWRDKKAGEKYREWQARHMIRSIRVRFDEDQFGAQDVVNLLARAGEQVGIGEGRPFSKSSNGMGFGTFRIE